MHALGFTQESANYVDIHSENILPGMLLYGYLQKYFVLLYCFSIFCMVPPFSGI